MVNREVRLYQLPGLLYKISEGEFNIHKGSQSLFNFGTHYLSSEQKSSLIENEAPVYLLYF